MVDFVGGTPTQLAAMIGVNKKHVSAVFVGMTMELCEELGFDVGFNRDLLKK